jgi:transcriptional regulator with XRE-family HTH domain
MDKDRLKQYREKFGLKQAEFARRLGVTPVTVWRWEHGKQPIPESVVKTISMMEELWAIKSLVGGGENG